MAAQSFAYHAHGIADCDKSYAVIHDLCAMTDQQCMLAQARPPIINHLTSFIMSGRYLRLLQNCLLGLVGQEGQLGLLCLVVRVDLYFLVRPSHPRR